MKKENSNSRQQTAGNNAGTKNYLCRAFFITSNIGSMQKTGLSEKEYMTPAIVANHYKTTWENSGEGRTAGFVVCKSANGAYHLHGGLYSKDPTTFQQVAKIMFDSHVEEQKTTKKQLTAYLLKQPPYDEKGETVLYELNIGCIKDAQGTRSIFSMIDDYLAQGMTPSEIMRKGTCFRKYEKLIKSAYLDKRISETPIVKDMHVEYHFGSTRTGKSHVRVQYYEEHSRDDVHLWSDHRGGGLDTYLEKGAPPVLFIEEMKGDIPYGQLLMVLDKYSDVEIHCRYSNTKALWTQVYMTSVYPIEELYQLMVEPRLRKTDSIEQLLRRINTIVYHYVEDGEYKTFSMPASEYKDHNDMMAKLHKATDGFQKVSPSEMSQIPFDTEEGH